MPDVVVAGPVLARSEEEGERLLASVSALAKCGLPVMLVDGGSPPDFLAQLSAMEGVAVHRVADPELRMIAQVQVALRGAVEQGARYILYTEPDKHDFFVRALLSFAATADSAAPDTGVIIAARGAEDFATFPAGQRLTESLFNTLATETLFLPAGTDVLYGPLLLRADLVPYVEQLRENVGWGWRTYLMAVCHRLGYTLATFSGQAGDLACPLDQRGEDDEKARLYRMGQMAQNIRGLTLGFSLLQTD